MLLIEPTPVKITKVPNDPKLIKTEAFIGTLQEQQTETPQEAFLRANLERIDDLKTRIKEHGKVKNFSGYMLKTALKMETDIHKILTELYIPENYPIERYCQTYRVGTSLKKHVFKGKAQLKPTGEVAELAKPEVE